MKDLQLFLIKWQDTVLNYLPKVALALFVLAAFYFTGRLFRKLSFKFYSKIIKKQVDLVRLISAAIYFFFLLSGVFLALEILGLDSVLTKVLAGAGILGIVAGFAFKDIASNVFAGFLLHMQRPFKTNDWVEITGNYGSIIDIGWITTSIKTIGGQEVFVPNQMIYNNTFTNFSSFNERRVILKSGVSYGDNLDLVQRVAVEEIQNIDIALKDKPIDFYFTSIGSSAYNFEIRFWINFAQQKDYMLAMSETIKRIKTRFEAENISIAYAVTTLDFGVKGGVNLFDQNIKVENIEAHSENTNHPPREQ